MTHVENHMQKNHPKDSDNLPLETAVDEQNDDDLFEDNLINPKSNKKRSKARIIRSVWYNCEKDPGKTLS